MTTAPQVDLYGPTLQGRPAVRVRLPRTAAFRVPGLNRHGRTPEEQRAMPKSKRYGRVKLGGLAGGIDGDLGVLILALFVFILLGIVLWYIALLIVLLVTPLIYLCRRKLKVIAPAVNTHAVTLAKSLYPRQGKPELLWSAVDALVVDTAAAETLAQLPERPRIHLAGVRQVRVEWADGSAVRVRIPWWNLWWTRRRLAAVEGGTG